jgi:quercetin dioxygenase-like cupin family protein
MTGSGALQTVVPCAPGAFDDTLAWFTGELGMRVATIFPADAPAVAVVTGHGASLRLDSRTAGGPGALRLVSRSVAPGEERVLVAPNGTSVTLVHPEPPVVVPELVPALVVTRAAEGDDPHAGRAGMRYRDLVPGRLGGRFVASHISIPGGGPVPDYVHHHRVRFQMIFCARGWVRVVYEDQGDPFVLHAGDCVLQPPTIRHRVLEASPGLEVVEVGCPAEHETHADPGCALPTGRVLPDRDYGGQRFVRHVAADARWGPWCHPGFEARDTGITAATDGIAGARVVRRAGSDPSGPDHPLVHDGELLLWYVLDGTARLRVNGDTLVLGRDDSVTVPAGMVWSVHADPDTELLEVTLPGTLPLRPTAG